MTALGIHMPKQDMVAMTWNRDSIKNIAKHHKIGAQTSFRTDLFTYRGCPIYPNQGGLLGVGQFSINKDAQLQVEQQGGAGHEREYGVQANLKAIQPWMDTAKTDETSIMNGKKWFVKSTFVTAALRLYTES